MNSQPAIHATISDDITDAPNVEFEGHDFVATIESALGTVAALLATVGHEDETLTLTCTRYSHNPRYAAFTGQWGSGTTTYITVEDHGTD